jgi:hypothetical protein
MCGTAEQVEKSLLCYVPTQVFDQEYPPRKQHVSKMDSETEKIIIRNAISFDHDPCAAGQNPSLLEVL